MCMNCFLLNALVSGFLTGIVGSNSPLVMMLGLCLPVLVG